MVRKQSNMVHMSTEVVGSNSNERQFVCLKVCNANVGMSGKLKEKTTILTIAIQCKHFNAINIMTKRGLVEQLSLYSKSSGMHFLV